MTSGYKINNVDTDLLYVRKDMFLEGNLWMWGNNGGGLGDNTTIVRYSPVQAISGGSNWKQILGGGESHSAAIKSDGTLWGWGRNDFGQLGNNTATGNSSPIQTITGGTNWKQVTTSYLITMAIKTDGTLWGWGLNTSGQLGDNTAVSKSSPVQTIAGGSSWKSISSGRLTTAAIKTDGTLWCWGAGTFGQLGDGTIVSKSSPVQTIAGGTNWKQAACGYGHVAAIKADGTLWSWGVNKFGQLGDGTSTTGWTGKSSPVQTIAGGTNWKQVACGTYTTIAVKLDGTLWTCGYNRSGELGDNTTVSKSSPVQTISGGTNWKLASTGGYGHTAALKTDGTLWMWGHNGSGQLGDNTIIYKSSPIQTIAGGTNWLNVTCGYQHTLALTDNLDYNTSTPYIPFMNTPSGTLYSWGDGYGGALGNGTSGRNNVSPVPTVPSYNNWIQVSGGYSFEAAIKTDGTLWTWGYNGQGRLGQGVSSGGNIYTPTQTAPSNLRWSQVSCNYTHMSAITISGALYGAGANSFGQLGLNNNTDSNSMSMVYGGGTNWKQTAAGFNFTAAIKTDGTLWMWGQDSYGQLGDNAITHKSSPVQTVAGGTSWSQVACGWYHTAAIKTDGTLWMWGMGWNGALGNNTITSRSSPVQTIAGGSNWTQVACGYKVTAAIKTDGTLWCWGFNSSGQLGDNTITSRSSPVQTVTGGTNWKQVSCGRDWTVAIKTDGTLWTWGNNGTASAGGNLGDNTNVNKSSPVQTTAGGNTWLYVDANMYTTTGIRFEAGTGQQQYTTPGTYSWVAPAGVYSVSVVAVGAGGGTGTATYTGFGGGALAYTNNIAVVPGQSYTVVVSAPGGVSSSFNTTSVAAGSGNGATGGTVIYGTGGTGGAGNTSYGGGGGAGGYSGTGGAGGYGYSTSPTAGAGGGGAGGGSVFLNNGAGGGGGGVGLLGLGTNGAVNAGNWGGTTYGSAGAPGGGGSSGINGGTGQTGTLAVGGNGGVYGGGAGGGEYNQSPVSTNNSGVGGSGAVRIIWPGTTRQFPSTNTFDM